MATIKDIAQKTGFGISTVSRALNDADDVSVATRKRIQRIAKQLGYVPNRHAQQLKQHQEPAIACFLVDSGGQYLMDRQRILRRAITASDLAHHHLTLSPDGPWRQRLADTLAMKPRGIIAALENQPWTGDMVELCKKNRVPLVLLDDTHPQADVVHLEQRGACSDAITHLIDQGRRQIVCFAPAHQAHPLRVAYVQTLTLRSMDVLPGYLRETQPQENWYEFGYQEVDSLFTFNQPFDALLMPNDEAAVGAMAALATHKRRIPHDVSVIGYHDGHIAPYTLPPLTSVHLPFESAAAQAVALIEKRVISPKRRRESVTLDALFVLRNSA